VLETFHQEAANVLLLQITRASSLREWGLGYRPKERL
jgi:hypothetical protein